jgi:16S rRNA (guanine527-N7)-methyltransferase
MTEDEAQAWLDRRDDVPRETLGRLSHFVELVLAESTKQNLISEASKAVIWSRHIVDSAQLLGLMPGEAKSLLDLGSGPGFPGIVIAIIRPDLDIMLVESRRKRIEFLEQVRESLGLTRVSVAGSRLETITPKPFDVISARAFAPLDRLLPLAHSFSTAKTRWLLPKGRSAAIELEAVQSSWQGGFRIEPSLTDPDAAIIVADNVQPKGRR